MAYFCARTAAAQPRRIGTVAKYPGHKGAMVFPADNAASRYRMVADNRFHASEKSRIDPAILAGREMTAIFQPCVAGNDDIGNLAYALLVDGHYIDPAHLLPYTGKTTNWETK